MLRITSKMENWKATIHPLYILIPGLFFVACLYGFGLSGTFLLDDYATLPALDQWGQVNSWDKLKHFISGGFTGPTGRPISLLSFAIQSSCWPDKPACFLLFNIILHIVNAFFVFIVLHILFSELNVGKATKQWLPLFVSLVWAAHPLNVSSVLYVIQRMVLLAAFFNLLCLACYLIARKHAFNASFKRASIWLVLSFLLAIMAVFSKENAVLIPMQLLLIEFLFKWTTKQNWPIRSGKLIGAVFIVGVLLPSLVIIFYLLEKLGKNIWHYSITGEAYAIRRPYTFFERLFTQFRVVGDYIIAIALPRIQNSGVFFDAYPLSKNFVQPISTLIWFLVHSVFCCFAWIVRKRWPIVAFGIFWFYVNHLIESTVITLEPKYEHRNYLPMLGLIMVATAAIVSSRSSKVIKRIGGMAVFIVLIVTLSLRTSLWGNPKEAVMVWVRNNPDSVRSLETAALVYSKEGGTFQEVAFLLKQAAEVSGNDPVMLLKHYLYVCEAREYVEFDVDKVVKSLEGSALNWQVAPVLDGILNKKISGVCPQLPLEEYQALALAVRDNIKYKKTSIPKKMNDFIARSELVFGDKVKAVDLYNSINYESTRLDLIMTQALWMASYGELEAAIEHLDRGINLSQGKSEFILGEANDMRNKMLQDVVRE